MPDPSIPSTPRTAEVHRTTGETDVHVAVNLDGAGDFENETGIGFFDHMLDLLARHGGFDLTVRCEGDLHVDDHHTVEDVGIALGQAFSEALGDKAHLARYGHATVPMDEALARAALDFSGRSFLIFEAHFSRERVGDFSTEMARHFWHSFAEHARCTLHVDLLRGENAHHQVEAVFKAVARALKMAVRRDPAGIRTPSTKGTF